MRGGVLTQLIMVLWDGIHHISIVLFVQVAVVLDFIVYQTPTASLKNERVGALISYNQHQMTQLRTGLQVPQYPSYRQVGSRFVS